MGKSSDGSKPGCCGWKWSPRFIASLSIACTGWNWLSMKPFVRGLSCWRKIAHRTHVIHFALGESNCGVCVLLFGLTPPPRLRVGVKRGRLILRCSSCRRFFWFWFGDAITTFCAELILYLFDLRNYVTAFWLRGGLWVRPRLHFNGRARLIFRLAIIISDLCLLCIAQMRVKKGGSVIVVLFFLFVLFFRPLSGNLFLGFSLFGDCSACPSNSNNVYL